MSKVQTLPAEGVLAALGVSARSFARRKRSPKAPLPLDEAGRLWRFAEVLAHATNVFGTQVEAEAWLARPAIGLARQRPIDLLKTPPGARMVSQHLTRLEYGVYT
jgi:putative toxin-antitoxin system antitoxin component (TIGR02293 family)